jgi:hypothetical protein
MELNTGGTRSATAPSKTTATTTEARTYAQTNTPSRRATFWIVEMVMIGRVGFDVGSGNRRTAMSQPAKASGSSIMWMRISQTLNHMKALT